MIKKIYFSELIDSIFKKSVIKYEYCLNSESPDDTMVSRVFIYELRNFLNSYINDNSIIIVDSSNINLNKCGKHAISMIKKFKSCFPCMVVFEKEMFGISDSSYDSFLFEKRFSNCNCFNDKWNKYTRGKLKNEIVR